MAHFAELNENNEVISVIVVGNQNITNSDGKEDEQIGLNYIRDVLKSSSRWVQTSYNNNFRVRFATITGTYNEKLDAFISPKPYESWVLNEETADWEAPIPEPNDGNGYDWNENTQTWDRI